VIKKSISIKHLQ